MKKGKINAKWLAGAVAVLLLAGTAGAQTHAPWPTDWNNWNDPALWATVGDPGNTGEQTRLVYGNPTYFGSVAYTYKIGKFDVTAGQYAAFLNAVGAADTHELYNTLMGTSTGCRIQRSGASGSYTYSIAPDYANRPVNYVSWADAARYANWLTNGQPAGAQSATTTEDGSYYLNGSALMTVTRKPNAKYVIPTEDEWYKAAYYKGGSANAGYWKYSTSSDTPPGQDMADASGNNANYDTWPWIYPIDSGTYYTTVVGEFQNSDSPYGTFDQGGNLSQWNETAVTDSGRGRRGGDFGSSNIVYVSSAFRGYLYPTGEGDLTGFRLAQVPEPATLTLLAIGGLAILRRRRKSE